MTAIEVRTETLAKIRGLLNSANGKRRTRTIGIAEVVEIIGEVVNGKSFANANGGTVANSYGHSAVTTLALVAKIDGRFYLGIQTAYSNGSTSPGRAWKSLQPFGETGPKGNAEAKWAEWIKGKGVIELAGPEIDAMLETGTIL